MKAGRASVEEFFAVEHVEDGVVFLRVGWVVVSGGEPDVEASGEVPLAAEQALALYMD